MSVSIDTDEVRVAQIGRYQVVTRPPRSDLVALVDVAAQVAGVPMATINLMMDTEQHQIATAGFEAAVCAREDSMCNVVFQGGVPVIVPDASQDDRFRDNPFVTGVIGDVRSRHRPRAARPRLPAARPGRRVGRGIRHRPRDLPPDRRGARWSDRPGRLPERRYPRLVHPPRLSATRHLIADFVGVSWRD